MKPCTEDNNIEFAPSQQIKQSFLCQPCDLRFSSEQFHLSHFKNVHGETNSQADAKKTTITALIVNNSILCGSCKIGYESEEAFKDHITSVH